MRLTRLSSPANLPLRIAVAGAIEVFGKKTSCNVGSRDYREDHGKDRLLFATCAKYANSPLIANAPAAGKMTAIIPGVDNITVLVGMMGKIVKTP